MADKSIRTSLYRYTTGNVRNHSGYSCDTEDGRRKDDRLVKLERLVAVRAQRPTMVWRGARRAGFLVVTTMGVVFLDWTAPSRVVVVEQLGRSLLSIQKRTC